LPFLSKEDSNPFKIYPNPSSTQITLQIPTTLINETPTFSIYNVNAQQIITSRLAEPLTIVDISSLPRGVYIARIIAGNMVAAAKFIKK
jgi:hypothetical protein